VNAERGRQLLLGVAALLLAGSCPPAPAHAQGGQSIDVEVVGDVVAGRPTEIVFRAVNPIGDAGQGSITVSLPGTLNVEIAGASAQGAKIFQPGEQMYNFGAGRAMPIDTRAAELFVGSWPTGARHELRLRVTSAGPYSLLARASFRRSNGSFVHLPASGQPDQQGAPTRALNLTPRSANPLTNTPPPPPPTNTPVPPPTQTPVPPDKPVAAKPAEPPPPTATVPPASAVGPVGAPTATPAPPPPTPTTAGASSQSGPSIPLLLAGFGIIAVGVAVGLVALLLLLRRRSDTPPSRAGWPPPGGPYPGPGGPYAGVGPAYPGPGYPPVGTARIPAGGTGGPAEPAFGGPYPGTPPPWSPPGGAAPWDRPPTPAPPQRPREEQPRPEPPRPPTPAGGLSRDDEHPTAARPPTGGGWPGQGSTPHPTSVEGLDGGASTPQGERYVERTLVGRGGMGSVFKAYDSRLRRWVALKIMHADLGLRPGFIDRFIREAQVAAMLEHPNIVTVYDIELIGDSIQMVMSWIEGQDLQRVLEQEGALDPTRAAGLLTQIAAALDHAHLRERPVLHRDIKPSNVMIGPHDRVILTDFGIARLIGDVSLTQTGQMVGTPAFMAPEVVQGEEADARADVYALGVLLYQMLTGQAPFRAQTPLALLHAQVHTPPPPPRSVVPTLPPGVDQVLARALAKNPAERFQSAGALARALRSALGLG